MKPVGVGSLMNERTIFIEALEQDSLERRAEYLTAACAGDVELRQRVEALLASHDEPGSFLVKTGPEHLASELAAGRGLALTGDGADPEGSLTDELGFLSPPTKDGSLGQLGHYDVQEVIGRGGMGVVLRAFDERLHRVVAIKVMAAQLATSATARKRFTREAQAVAAVSHEHVVTIHAVEEANGRPYIVMHFVAGTSLEERIERGGPLELHEILRIGMQTASGLAAAHAQGLIHRDIKPANILLENGVERVKITDFGLARAAADASLTQTGAVAGTPNYMAPEQARGDTLDARTDLFSLGSVLYTMCTGHSPFRASGSMAVLKRVCEERPTPIREANPAIPEWLAAIIDKLHAKDPAERFQTAAQVTELLGRHLAHLQHPSVAKLPAHPNAAELASPRSTPPARRTLVRPRWAVAASVLLCAFSGISLTEATGVTQLTSTVVSILTPQGTLVVEVDDPGVNVTIEGDGGLVVTGAGPQEVRLRPGSYQVHANKEGQPATADRELVTISRGDRQVVRVRLEGSREAQIARSKQPLAPDEIRRFAMPDGAVRGVAYSPDGRQLLTGAANGTVRLWDVESGKALRELRGHVGQVDCVAFSPRAPLAFSCAYDGTIRVWDLDRGAELRRLEGHTEGVRSIAVTADGRRLLSGSWDKTMRWWDVDQGKELRLIAGHTHPVYSVAVSPDSHLALSGCASPDPFVRHWNLDTATQVRTLEGHHAGVYCVAVLPDGRHALSASADQVVRLWDLESGTLLRRLVGHTSDVITVAPSPDGRYAVTGSWDGSLRWWSLDTGTELRRFELPGRPNVLCVAYAPDGRTVLSGDADGIVRLWRLPDSHGPDPEDDSTETVQQAVEAQPSP